MVHCLALTLNLLILCAEQGHSAVSSQTYVVEPNDNVTLSCNISCGPKASHPDTVSWLHYRENELTEVMTTEFSKISKSYMRVQSEDNFQSDVNNEMDPWSLLITGVKESDLGVYHCLVQRDKALIAEATIRLLLTGDGLQSSAVCWSLLACVGLTAAALGALVIFLIGRFQAKHCCDHKNKDLQRVDLHYASLKCHGVNGQEKVHPAPDVTYATVANHSSVNASGLIC